jgi:hypothetical protein
VPGGVTPRVAGDPPPEEYRVRPLLEDGSLELAFHSDLRGRVEPWIPHIPERASQGRARARITVDEGRREFEIPERKPSIQLRSVSGWCDATGRILLDAAGARLSAVVDPGALRAAVRMEDRTATGEEERVEVFAILTLAAAFLLGRLGRTLIHAAAVVGPGERGWLLVGGTFSGKTTCCVNLIRQGWDYLSDDHVVMCAGDAGPGLEGWPRNFNLDRGFEEGSPIGIRRRVDPAEFGPGRWRSTAALGGLLFPTVGTEQRTRVERSSAPGALHRLLQQSPWLLGDPGTAPAVLDLLGTAARLPAFDLLLGADALRDGRRVAELLEREMGSATDRA